MLGKHWIALGLVVAALAGMGQVPIASAAEPTVVSIIEGQEAGTANRVVVLYGARLNKVKGVTLQGPGTSEPFQVDLTLRPTRLGKTALLLELGEPVPQGSYSIGLLGKNDVPYFSGPYSVDITNGGAVPGTVGSTALDAGLRADLDDAETLNGQPGSYYTNLANAAGTLGDGRFDAYANLVAKNRLGTGAGQLITLGDVPAYAAGTGLSLSGTTFSVDLAALDSRYLLLSGGSMTGALTVTTTGTSITGNTNSVSGYGISGTNTNALGRGVLGSAPYMGVRGVASANSGSAYGVEGSVTSAGGIGVLGNATFGVGVSGTTTSGTGVQASANTGGNALAADFQGSGSSTSSANNIARFTASGTPQARITNTGLGIFNGGTQTGGADFAESVAVNASKSTFEPGDVIAVDTEADRRFALCSEAESPLVAGVYSTKPGVLAMPRDCAAMDDSTWNESEIPLAIVGIVPVKVCDEGGAIQRGDLLVSASLHGYAKKAPVEVKPGTLIGISVGRLATGKGRVEVLLKLR